MDPRPTQSRRDFRIYPKVRLEVGKKATFLRLPFETNFFNPLPPTPYLS